MIVLGISDNHESHACVVRDGELVAAIAEERLSRLKADSRYPRRAVDKVLEIAGVTPQDVDVVAFAGSSAMIWQTLYNKTCMFSIADWLDEMDNYWAPKLLRGEEVSSFFLYDNFKHLGGDDIESEPYFPTVERCRHLPPEKWQDACDEVRHQVILDQLGIPAEKVVSFRHEDCHKAYGFFSSPYERRPALILTSEGGGDDSSATVSTSSALGELTEHWKSNRVQFGRLYAYVTLILGMKPQQHEYKLMGLAPYGTRYHGEKTLEFFKRIHSLDGIEIVNNDAVKDLYFSILEGTRGQRFDGIAWAIQEWLEEMLCGWTSNCVRHFEQPNVILSGGVAQNIKACKRLMELPEVDRLWVGPTSGDGSLAIGAAWMASQRFAPENEIMGMPNIYLGTEYGRRDVEKAMEAAGVQSSFAVTDEITPSVVADWCADGKIVARYSGRMEFGQRALGNRSILADPRLGSTVERVNAKIKYRDFWMPFTPSMTDRQAEVMLKNDGGAYSPYMTLAFDLKPEFSDTIPAAMHPADKSVRPQMLQRESNPGYYDLLTAFEQKSGMACLMNTSFNLHGEPVVESPKDAISTFERSELDVLLFDDYAIMRTPV